MRVHHPKTLRDICLADAQEFLDAALHADTYDVCQQLLEKAKASVNKAVKLNEQAEAHRVAAVGGRP